MEILSKTDVKSFYLKVKYDNKIYEIIIKFDEETDNYIFYYKNGEKPNDIDFEYNILCNL